MRPTPLRERHPSLPCVLVLAGWDPSGGAGAAADLRAVRRAGAWGCAAITVLTVQSTAGLRASQAVPARHLLAAANEILVHEDVRALKIGALGPAENARAVLRFVTREASGVPIVLDPVLGATRGRPRARLLDPDALAPLLALAARATLVTPNAPEAARLTRLDVRDHEDAVRAAEVLLAGGARAVLVKGGHLAGPVARDVLALAHRTVVLEGPRFAVDAHGTGCTLASLAAGKIAVRKGALTDHTIVHAVRWAKKTLTESIAVSARIGDGMFVLDP